LDGQLSQSAIRFATVILPATDFNCAGAAVRPQLGPEWRYLIRAATPSRSAIAISNQTAPIAIIIGPEHFIIIIVSSFLFVRP